MNDNVALASNYRMTAVVFWESAKRLHGSFETSGESVIGNRMAVPFYFLVSHSAELLLKCALLKRGVDQRELLKHGVRHDLRELITEITSKGIPVTVNTAEIITRLADQHRRHALRYTVLVEDGEVTFTPDPLTLCDALDELLMLGRISTYGI
jgi:hypothetical protein